MLLVGRGGPGAGQGMHNFNSINGQTNDEGCTNFEKIRWIDNG